MTHNIERKLAELTFKTTCLDHAPSCPKMALPNPGKTSSHLQTRQLEHKRTFQILSPNYFIHLQGKLRSRLAETTESIRVRDPD